MGVQALAGEMDGPAFVHAAEAYLHPIAPIMQFAVKKQMSDLSATPENLTPDLARQFIDRIVNVLKTFAPSPKVEETRQALLRELRRAAPGYADSLTFGGKP